jgi:phosphatidylglycerophosphate synthase
MTASRWQLPDSPLRISFAVSLSAGLAAVIGASLALRSALELSALYPFSTGAVFAATMIIAVGFLVERHPFERFGSANQITTFRAMLVALVAGLAGEATSTITAAAAATAVAASVVVTMLDGVDGWLARRDGIESAFGARFDMEIDALLILVLSVLAWRGGKAGIWVLGSGLLRYLFVAAGAVAPWFNAPLPPSRRRQTICVLQVAGLTLVMVPAVVPPLSTAIAAVALALLAYSFFVDTAWLWRNR